MLAWLKIAVRNLYKNSRRSLFTVLAIGLGFAAINVFGGFTSYIFTSLQDAYIYAQGNGHLTIFKQGFLTKGKLEPTQYLLSREERQRIKAILDEFADIVVVTAQLHISGLLSNGEVSTIFIAAGRVPSHMQLIRQQARGFIGRGRFFTGKPLQDDVTYGVGLSFGLAEQLQLGIGSDVIAMAPTVDGQINALDAQVFQLFGAPVEPLNDKLMLVPLAFAQSLYDTTSVDRMTVLLRDTSQTEARRDTLARVLSEQGLKVEVKTWQELSFTYTKVKNMFDVIFLFIFVIVSVIAVMSIINTISMAIIERTREIGTLRALGVKRYGIVRLFALESAMLGVFGVLLGLCLTIASWLIVTIARPTWLPPMVVYRVPLEVHLVPQHMLVSGIVLVFLSVIATLLPARKAARMAIVEALGHV
jgi:putative ABC transport system permease protein